MAENERKSDFTGNSGGKSPKKLRVLLRTFGCQMNVRDSEVIRGLLKKAGYQISDDPKEADVFLFNTCSVRQHAEDKAWSEIGRFTKQGAPDKEGGTHRPVIGLIGCMAKNYGQDAFRKAEGIDFIVGPSDIAKIPEIISKFVPRPSSLAPRNLYELKIWETDGELRPEEIYHTGHYQDKEHAYVVISEGCSNYCSYCVVPYVRGAPRNRNYKDILKEIEEALDKGIDKITLLGQNVNAYQCNGVSFVRFIGLVNNIKGLKEFSFITSHPKDTSLDLFKAMADSEKLKKYLHLPVQSGSDKILGLMNRGYTRKFYLDLVDNYRKMVKDASLTTDIIAGFPAETEDDFQATCDLIKTIEYDAAYIFKYSPRPHTAAAILADDVSGAEKSRRHKIILDLQREISRKKKC